MGVAVADVVVAVVAVRAQLLLLLLLLQLLLLLASAAAVERSPSASAAALSLLVTAASPADAAALVGLMLGALGFCHKQTPHAEDGAAVGGAPDHMREPCSRRPAHNDGRGLRALTLRTVPFLAHWCGCSGCAAGWVAACWLRAASCPRLSWRVCWSCSSSSSSSALQPASISTK